MRLSTLCGICFTRYFMVFRTACTPHAINSDRSTLRNIHNLSAIAENAIKRMKPETLAISGWRSYGHIATNSLFLCSKMHLCFIDLCAFSCPPCIIHGCRVETRCCACVELTPSEHWSSDKSIDRTTARLSRKNSHILSLFSHFAIFNWNFSWASVRCGHLRPILYALTHHFSFSMKFFARIHCWFYFGRFN